VLNVTSDSDTSTERITTFSAILVSSSDEVSAEIIDVTLLVHKVLLFLTFNLDALQSLSSKVVRVVDIDNILIFFFAGNTNNSLIL
jgi:hypothetical protein